MACIANLAMLGNGQMPILGISSAALVSYSRPFFSSLNNGQMPTLGISSAALASCPRPFLRTLSSNGQIRGISGSRPFPSKPPFPFCQASQIATSANGVDDLKASLHQALAGLNKGIFGVSATEKTHIEQLIESLEKQNPLPRPVENLEKVEGDWKLLYSTITILGSKRTKLGLRDFIALGDFIQTINIEQKKAINTVKFNVAGMEILGGALTIEASYKPCTPSRVEIFFEQSDIHPKQLMNLFKKNYDLLLSIFNPEGWLEITFVDDDMRIGRDDKGNIFVLERSI